MVQFLRTVLLCFFFPIGIHIRKVDHVNIHNDISINIDKSEDDRGIKKNFISSGTLYA